MVTIGIGDYQQAQGELLSVEGSIARIRIGSRVLMGVLLTDLSRRRRTAA